MRIISIKAEPSTDGAQERVTIAVEEKRNDAWLRREAWDVMAGTKEADRKLMINDGDRIIIETQADHMLVYDKEQMVSTPVPIDQKAQDEKNAFTAEQEAKSKELRRRDDEERRKLESEGRVVKTNLGNPVVPQPTKKLDAEVQREAELQAPDRQMTEEELKQDLARTAPKQYAHANAPGTAANQRLQGQHPAGSPKEDVLGPNKPTSPMGAARPQESQQSKQGPTDSKQVKK